MTLTPVHIVGGGLAGSEAAWQLAQADVPVVLHEMRPHLQTAAHKTDGLAELVCSNSFRSDDKDHNAVGLLHEEMRRLGSLVMQAADRNQVPAGGALAVDRDGFSTAVTTKLTDHPLITLDRGEVELPPPDWDSVIIATGPLTSSKLATNIRQLTGEDQLAFFDAIAPIVHRESIDLGQAWFQSRYDKAGPGGTGAYPRAIRCLRRGAHRRRQSFVPRLGSHDALFRRLPADRGDGRARSRNASSRADETVRPDQSARARRQALCGRATASGQ
jgi:methylenetetrahydrofolate--tRNA-(uracil-5-)-methyltransferase